MSKEESFTYEEYLVRYGRKPETTPEEDLAETLADITIKHIENIFRIIKEARK